MALQVLFVDGDVGSDLNSGSSAGASTIAAGTGAAWGLDDTVIDLSADSPDLSGVSSDGSETIRIDGQTEGLRTTDVFKITAVDDGSDTVTVSATPGAAESGVTWAIGGATKTIQRAVDTSEADMTCHIKNSADYTETITHGQLSGTTIWVRFIGYSTTPDDGGMVVIDGEDTRARGWAGSAGTNQIVLKNIWCKNHTGDGFGLGTSDFVRLKNCRSSDNGGKGFSYNQQITFTGCYAHDNDGDGIFANDDVMLESCISSDNGGIGVLTSGGSLLGCLIFGNTGGGYQKTAVSLQLSIRGCTIRGVKAGGDIGIDIPSGDAISVVNNIVTNSVTGIRGGNGFDTEKHISQHNLLFDNTADYVDWSTRDGEVTSDPLFVDVDNADFTLDVGSPALAAAFSVESRGFLTFSGDQSYIGALPPAASAGYPAEADVESGVVYGESSEFTGNFTEPGVANVAESITYGGGGTEFTGELVVVSGGSSGLNHSGHLS